MPGQRVPQRLGKGVPQQVRGLKARHARLFDHRTVVENGHAVGHAQGQLDVVGDQQHAAARVGKGAQVVQGVNSQVKVQARRWLVGNDQARVVHQRAHKKDAPGHAAAQLVRIGALNVRPKAIFVKQLMHPRASLGRARRPQDLVAHAHQRVEVAHALRHHTHAAPAQRRQTRSVLLGAIKPYTAVDLRVIGPQAHQAIGQDRLARTRGTHHGQHLAHVDTQ